jgi:hypothetical protein
MHQQESIEKLLEANERSLLEPAARKSGIVGELLAESFVEFGSSGRVFTKAQIMSALLEESPVAVSASDFKVRLLAPGVALVTYLTERHVQPPVHALRSSVWGRGESGWQMVFHQGTRSGAQT